LLKPTLIFLGAGTGGLLRWWIGNLLQHWYGPTFPVGTMLVNITGCLAIGFLAAFWAESTGVREEVRLAVLVGVLGGYTTFSTFGRESLELIQDGQWWRVGVYVIGSVVLGLLAVWIGAALAGRIAPATSA
jgi:CrcB protein